jgi:Bacterial membrane protein YfhO
MSIKETLARIINFIKKYQWLLLFLELVILVSGVLLYSSPLLNLDSTYLAPGLELQPHISTLNLLIEWLHGKAEFPLWNPIYETGRPWLADPFLFAFNPFYSLPFLLLGITNGVKIAYLINFVLAALGTWTLAKFLGLNAPARLWAGYTFAFSGGIVSHFTAGQPQLAFSLGWLPWATFSVFWVIKSKSVTSIVVTAIIQGLFFLTGNLYYQVYSLAAVLAIVVSFILFNDPSSRTKAILRLLVVGVLTLGFISITLIPLLSARKYILNTGGYNIPETNFVGSQKPVDSLLNYYLDDPAYYTSALFGKMPFLQESYRYIGFLPFVCLLWIIPAYERGKKRGEIVGLALAFLILLAWAGIQFTFFKYLYHWLPILNQFRFPGRALGAGALFLILLAAFGIDRFWKDADEKRKELLNFSINNRPVFEVRTSWMINLCAMIILISHVYFLYLQNKQFTAWGSTSETQSEGNFLQVMNTDQTPLVEFTNTMLIEQVDHIFQDRIRGNNLWDGWKPAGAPVVLGDPNAIKVIPKYWVVWEVEPTDIKHPILVQKIGNLRIWQDPDALPYAFTVDKSSLYDKQSVSSPAQVQNVVAASRQWPNQISVQVDLAAPEVLIVTESWFPDWKVVVDGAPGKLESVSSFLAVSLNSGQHVIRFRYDPWSVKLGLAISCVTLLVMILAVIGEGRHWSRLWQKRKME